MSVALVLAGCPFAVGPEDALSAAEARVIRRIAAGSAVAAREGVPLFHLTLVPKPPWDGPDLAALPDHVPARVAGLGGAIRVEHRRLLAEIDPVRLTGRLFRSDPDGGALAIAIRVALCAWLPSLGALPLHALGLALDGAGVAFFGPSGAGKSTLAAAFGGPVLSDELVAASPTPPTLFPTGLFGELESATRRSEEAPLAALVELAKGPAWRLDRLERSTALRRLIGSVLVPAVTEPWQKALSVAGELARSVPTYRMEWTPTHPPWDELRAVLTS